MTYRLNPRTGFNSVARISAIHAEVESGATAEDAEKAEQYALTFFNRQKALLNVNVVEQSLSCSGACATLGVDPANPMVPNGPDGHRLRKLKPHQVLDVAWLKAMEAEDTNGCILANEAGTGQTLIALAYLVDGGNCRASMAAGPWRPSLV
ncbi:uncharacterized protein BKCO1_3800010 [Diplodia corticola]|uniref:SNF2 N-terminal domain-containing protein n=1 Tax=Diplodia corticola TaxID=236234 RepID=A0A1J9QTT5_9PEZI|nr:uncharacterized protein BKCO1_3800010 [Diplodia corticola]OJD32390.1 hypothetical protein BKCO1_3800010 [Diplodia corticola]